MNRRKGRFLIDGIGDTHELYDKCYKHNKVLYCSPLRSSSFFRRKLKYKPKKREINESEKMG